MYPWDHWRTLVPMILGIAGLALFAIYECLGASMPLLNPSIFKNRSAIVTLFGVVIHSVIVSPLTSLA